MYYIKKIKLEEPKKNDFQTEKNLENGEILSSDSIQGKNISELEAELKQLARKLYIHREE